MNIKIINKPLPLNKYRIKAPYNMTPIGITIHETDNNAPARNEVAYMQNNNNSASFHFAVDENEIIQGAPLNKNTWHAGDGRGNGSMRTISIEICRNYRTNDLTNYYKARVNAEKLAGYLLSKYNWNESNIYTHNHWSGKNCPRVILKEGYLTTFKKNAMRYKNGQLGEPSKPVDQGKPDKPKLSNKEIAKLVLKGDYGNGQTRITKLTTEGYNPKEVQKEVDILTGKNKLSQPSKPSKPANNDIKVDGYWGPNTTRKLQQVLGTTVDGVISGQYPTSITRNIQGVSFNNRVGSSVIRELQRRLGVKADGYIGPETVRRLQKYLGTPIDGNISRPSLMVRTLQNRLNSGKF